MSSSLVEWPLRSEADIMYMLTNHTHLLLAETGGGRSLKGNSVEAKETGALGGMRCGKYVGGGHIAMEWKGTKKTHTHTQHSSE